MKKKTAIALSGGIDSLVAAHLLKKQGHEIIGIHFLTGYEKKYPDFSSARSQLISILSDQLGIDVHILDCSKEFKTTVVKNFLNLYQNGQTPNPCLVCNPTIKFGTVFTYAQKLGASCLATGHYVRLEKDKENKTRLMRGKDAVKDQSYFLALMTQQQLSEAIFPLGNLTKSQVRNIARDEGLQPVIPNESQDICFIPDNNYISFILNHLNIVHSPGIIEHTNGQVIGEHTGLYKYTVGQRRGINCPGPEPYYVIQIDAKQNRLIVGSKKDLLVSEFKVRDINWVIASPMNPISAHTQVRYRSKAYGSKIIPIDKKTALVKFKKPQSSVAPGQGAVFYNGNEMIGGGWIASKYY